jgi:hypothetical protein
MTHHPVLSYATDRRPWGWPAGVLALGFGLVVGFLLGSAITGLRAGTPPASFGDPDHDKVPVIRVSKPAGTLLAVAAGIIVGVAGALAARSHPLLLALTASVLAAASSVATIVYWQWHRGRWPVGTIDGRMFAVAAALLVLVCSGGLVAGGLVTSVKRRRT